MFAVRARDPAVPRAAGRRLHTPSSELRSSRTGRGQQSGSHYQGNVPTSFGKALSYGKRAGPKFHSGFVARQFFALCQGDPLAPRSGCARASQRSGIFSAVFSGFFTNGAARRFPRAGLRRAALFPVRRHVGSPQPGCGDGPGKYRRAWCVVRADFLRPHTCGRGKLAIDTSGSRCSLGFSWISERASFGGSSFCYSERPRISP